MSFFKWLFSGKEVVYIDDLQKRKNEELINLLESGNVSLHSGMGIVTQVLKRLVEKTK